MVYEVSHHFVEDSLEAFNTFQEKVYAENLGLISYRMVSITPENDEVEKYSKNMMFILKLEMQIK